MRLVHRPAGDAASETVLATEIATADSFWARTRGLMFRRSIPDDYALVFRFDEPGSRDLHMLFVPFAIDAVWLVDGEVIAVERLRPWLGLAKATADTVVELPAGAAADVEPGDTVALVDG
ncbi:MAG: DUF192 domain-containing protein [Halohasta sp.]